MNVFGYPKLREERSRLNDCTTVRHLCKLVTLYQTSTSFPPPGWDDDPSSDGGRQRHRQVSKHRQADGLFSFQKRRQRSGEHQRHLRRNRPRGLEELPGGNASCVIALFRQS